MSQGGTQGEQGAGVFELPIDAGVGTPDPVTASFQTCAWDNSNPTASLAIMRNSFESTGLQFGDNYLNGAKDLVPTFSDCKTAPAQAVAENESDSLSMSNIFAQVAKDVRGHSGMDALKNQAFDDLVRAA